MPEYTMPPDAVQPGGQPPLDTLDTRLTQAVADIDPDAGLPAPLAVWTQHTVLGADNLSTVRWYELLPVTLAVRQQGDVVTPGRYIQRRDLTNDRGECSARELQRQRQQLAYADSRPVAPRRHAATPPRRPGR